MKTRILTALPVFNEESHITDVLSAVRRFADDILVVDDGSSDRTGEILAKEPGIEVLTHAQNQGYGAALRSAFHYAVEHQYDVLVTIDCDGQHEPRLIPELAAALNPPDSPPVDIVSGSRYLQVFDGDSVPPEERRSINVAITAQLNREFGFHLTDAFCGFKAYRVEILSKFRITELGYAMPLQVWVQAAAHGMAISEFPIPLIYLEEERSFGGSLDNARRRMAYYQEVLKREMAAVALSCGDTHGEDCQPA